MVPIYPIPIARIVVRTQANPGLILHELACTVLWSADSTPVLVLGGALDKSSV